MDEKEIEQIIAEVFADWHMKAYAGAAPLPWWTEEAAHAIHERLQEGVVWEGEAHVDAFGRIRFGIEGGESYVDEDSLITEEMFYPDLAGGKGGILDLAGKRVQVTVRRIPCNEPTSLDSGEE